MITVRNRFVPTARATAAAQDSTYSQTSDQAYEWLAGVLSWGYSLDDVSCTDEFVSLVFRAAGRDTGSLFEYTFTGPPVEMLPCLAAVYYHQGGEPLGLPLDGTSSGGERYAKLMKRHPDHARYVDAISRVLHGLGYQPVKLKRLSYYLGGGATSQVAVMLFAGITDPAVLERGAAMEVEAVFKICQVVRLSGISFAEAEQQVA